MTRSLRLSDDGERYQRRACTAESGDCPSRFARTGLAAIPKLFEITLLGARHPQIEGVARQTTVRIL